MSCYVNFLIFVFLISILGYNFIKNRKFSFESFYFNFLFLILFLIFGFLTGKGIYNIVKFGSCQKPLEIIFKGGAGPMAIEGKCPFADVLCIFMDEAVLKALNLPEPKDQKVFEIYKRLPTIFQWRVMTRAVKELNKEDVELFKQYFKEQDGYQMQILFYNKVPNYKRIIEEELQRLRKEVLETIYGEEI